jgi:hypothetical protein
MKKKIRFDLSPKSGLNPNLGASLEQYMENVLGRN